MPFDIPGTSARPHDEPGSKKCPTCKNTYKHAVLETKRGKVTYRCPICNAVVKSSEVSVGKVKKQSKRQKPTAQREASSEDKQLSIDKDVVGHDKIIQAGTYVEHAAFVQAPRGTAISSELVDKIEKGIKYSREPERFAIREFRVNVRGSQRTHQVEYSDGDWKCDCEFFATHEQCSHTIAIAKVLGSMLLGPAVPSAEAGCRVLVVDRDADYREVIKQSLLAWGYRCFEAQGHGPELLRDAIDKAQRYRCHLALVEMRLMDDDDRSDTSGIDLIPEIRPTETIIVSNFGDYQQAVEAIKQKHALDFVGKEQGPSRLREVLDRAAREYYRTGLTIEWYPTYEPVQILAKLRLSDPAVPEDEPRDLLTRLYSPYDSQVAKAVAQIALRPVTALYRSSEEAAPLERSIVLVAQPIGADHHLHQAEIVKIALADQIRNEINSYRDYVEGHLPSARTSRVRDAKNEALVLWDMGAIRYSNIATADRRPLRQWYAKASARKLEAALKDLFTHTLGPWYHMDTPQSAGSVYEYYTSHFSKLGPRIEGYADQRDFVDAPGLPYPLRNPVIWARQHAPQSRFVSKWAAYTHGDLHGDNIFVDQRTNATYVIDYERSGPGYVLRDFAELETDIRLRLVPFGTGDFTLAHQLDLMLLAPEHPDDTPVWRDLTSVSATALAEARKAFEVIIALRRLAVQCTHIENMDEYYWALLMETLISVLRNYQDWDDQNAALLSQWRAMIAASVLTERLAQWGKTWPPKYFAITEPQRLSSDEIPPLAYLDYPINIAISIYRDGSRYQADIHAVGQIQRVPIEMSANDVMSLNQQLQDGIQVIAGSTVGGKRPSAVSLDQQIRTLAELGNFAFKSIFSHPDALAAIQELLGLSQKVSLQITSEDFFLPWELMYPHSLDEPISSENFWGMNYTISRVIVQEHRPSAFVSPMIMVSSLDQLVLRTFKIAHFTCHAVCDREISQAYCDSLGEKAVSILEDSQANTVNFDRFPFLFINAHETNNPNPPYTSNFVSALLAHGARAVVATEYAIWDDFAVEFARHMFTCLLAGETLGDSLLVTRRYFWEERKNSAGLLYSMYAPPSIRLVVNSYEQAAKIAQVTQSVVNSSALDRRQDDNLIVKTSIGFENELASVAVRVSSASSPGAILNALSLPSLPRGVILIVGGAATFPPQMVVPIRGLMEALVDLALKNNLMIVDSATAGGIAAIIGKSFDIARRANPEQCPLSLIGFAPEERVTYPGKVINLKEETATEALDPNHPYFVLVQDGAEWGDEIACLLSFIQSLAAQDCRSLVLVVDGGRLTLQMVAQSVRNNCEIIVLRRSGRATEAIAAALESALRDDLKDLLQRINLLGSDADAQEIEIALDQLQEIATSRLIRLFELNDSTENFGVLIASMLSLGTAKQQPDSDAIRIVSRSAHGNSEFLLEEYLTAVREYCANLPYLTLHDIRPSKTLDEVYVPLIARPRSLNAENNLSFSIAEVMQIRDVPHVLILGEPGAGKSTLLRQMAERAWNAPNAIGLRVAYLPLLVPLRQLASASGSLDERLRSVLENELALIRSLPEGFFAHWPQQVNARWLILLDALDEVPDMERARLMQWLKGQLPHLREHRVVITSRPIGYKDDFDAQTFRHYDLLPFTMEQTGELAHKWFNDKADPFLKGLDRIRVGDLNGSPLLLTIAAMDFTANGKLSERRSALYKQFITIWLNEARLRIERELDRHLWYMVMPVLAHLALEMIRGVTRAELYQATARYLVETMHLLPHEAEEAGRKLFRTLEQQSGLFTHRHSSYYFLHPIFQDYLAASAIVQESKQDLDQIWSLSVSRWAEARWREVVVLVLSILSDEDQDVTPLLRRIQQEGNASLAFLRDALAENLKVDSDFTNAYYELIRSTYRLVFNVTPHQLVVGQRLHLRVELAFSLPGADTFQLPANAAQLYCFVSGDGLRVVGTEVTSMQLDFQTNQPVLSEFELQAYLYGERAFSVDLFVDESGSGQAHIYRGQGHVKVIAPEARENKLTPLSLFDIRVAPSPDIVLRVEHVQTRPRDQEIDHYELVYRVNSHLPGSQVLNQVVGTVTLSAIDLKHCRALVSESLQASIDASPEDAHDRMLSVGTYLFDQLFPAESCLAFREILGQMAERAKTVLIEEDGSLWWPWELIVPYHESHHAPLYFLGERYYISRWVAGLGPPLYGEVPLGEIAITHYKALEPGQEALDEELQAWQKLLDAPGTYGILQVVKPETAYYGLHVLRHANQISVRRDIVSRDDDASSVLSTEEEVSRARLDLRLKRPVITLSILGETYSGVTVEIEDWLLPERVLPFLRAGASAVVGPWWPTCEAADRVFWPIFYALLGQRVPLGEAVWRGRQAVKHALPHRLDWLAYTLFGDPRARPYWPQPSEGYSVLECLNPDSPLRAGKTYVFRASIRSRPPIWHQDLLVHVESLPETPRALFLAPGLQMAPPEPIEMTALGRTMVQATYQLTPDREGEFPLIVRLLDGEERLQSLQMRLVVGSHNG